MSEPADDPTSSPTSNPSNDPPNTLTDQLGGRTPLTEVRRNPAAARYDRETVHAILDEARYSHIGFVLDGAPVVLPTIHDRIGDLLYVHGSRSNRMLKGMTAETGACLTATLFDGLVLARSQFNHTYNYRSAVVFGHPQLVTDDDEKIEALAHLVEHVLPGRADEARGPNQRELTLTAVVRMPIGEASAKIDQGPPDDDPDDLDYAVWAGVVPSRPVWGIPIPDTNVDPDRFPVPPSVRRLLEGTPR